MFHLVRIENARMSIPEPEYLEAAAGEAIVPGEALVLTNGKLTKCGATTAPVYISLAGVGAAEGDREIPVCRAEKNQLWRVPVTSSPAALVSGTKVTLHTDACQVTATTEGGVVTVADTLGASAAGAEILVRI